MARERYLVNQGEETIHDGEIKLETPQQKRQNWWFYNKGILLILLAAALILISVIYSVLSQVDPDYTIALMTSYTMSDTAITQLEDCISQYADDRNGDGKIEVFVTNYVFSNSSSDYEQAQASLVKFTADCTTNEVMLYLHDETAFDSMKGNFQGLFQYTDGSAMPENATDFENAMIPWEDIPAFAQFQPVVAENDAWDVDVLNQLFSKLRISVRTSEGSSIEKSEKDTAYYEASMKLYERLKSGEKWDDGKGYYDF